MSKFISSHPSLSVLKNLIADELKRLKREQTETNKQLSPKRNTLSYMQTSQAEKNAAAKIIQNFWHKHKIKEKLAENTYESYLSMMDKNDESFLTSAIIFGRHVAELPSHSRYRLDNPNILENDDAAYHRSDPLHHLFLRALGEQFGVNTNDTHFRYLPILMEHSLSAEELLNNTHP